MAGNGDTDLQQRYERLADVLVDEAMREATSAADALRLAHAGKAALEAAKLAALDETDVAKALRAIRTELAGIGIGDEEVAMMTVTETLQAIVSAGAQTQRLTRMVSARRRAYEALQEHVERLQRQARELADQDESARRAANRHAEVLEMAASIYSQGE